MTGPGGQKTRDIPYMTLRFLSSNSRLEYNRSYLKIIDIMGLIGGVSQVFTYFVIIFYSWYNSIRME